ncbi:metal-dependent hydrolase [Rhodococcus sp. IEGM 1379]|uniref:metal-dependent hydrolase n=1 Tax=Rhodococcus sp. IEGM 1379 TaxID=3047086 RepID=UPI0024B69DA7|nr:metal-dependent hydrolase [Rhodococcus sp. IEGM 1379]MDI9914892.1 metal-dependent hydrolase [Rhodococcus sp. IEGM 1379]
MLGIKTFRGKPVVAATGARRYTDEAHAIAARDVEFDWDGVPLHYVPNEPMVTHVINFMHLVLPEGERAMSATLAEALPLIEDPRLHEEVVGFVGQEATHATSHKGAREHLAELGMNMEPMSSRMDWLVDKILGDKGLSGKAKHAWLCERLGLFAAMEHFTAVFGEWLLTDPALENAGMHPMMLDMVKWHGAEEVEHRNVAFDAYMYVDGSYARRVRTALLASFTLIVLFGASMNYLFRQDPSKAKGRFWPLQLISATRRGLVPNLKFLITEMPPYLRPSFHPSQIGDMDVALRYLARSPAANHSS